MAFFRTKSLSIEAQAISKIEEKVKSLSSITRILDGLRENCLIEECSEKTIAGIKDMSKRNKKLFKVIIKMVDEYNFKKICFVLHSEDSCTAIIDNVMEFYSILSSIDEIDWEKDDLDMLLQILTAEQLLTIDENKQINKHKPNMKQILINSLCSKPLRCFTNFLHHLHRKASMHPLQMKILNKRSEIDNYVSFTRSVSSNTLASISSSDIESFNEWQTADLAGLPSSNNTIPSIKESQQVPSVLDNYKERLKRLHKRLPILSKQAGLSMNGNTADRFIDVTIVKPEHEGGQNKEYSTDSNEILEHQIEYNAKVYDIYKMFEAVDGKNRQFIVLEGNAGSGKTTVAYKFCKEWAEEKAFLQFSHVILLQLRDMKPGMIGESAEWLFSEMGKLKDKIHAEMLDKDGCGVLFWLEGWDELDKELKFHSSVFADLISGRLFLQATIVVSTRPAPTGSLKKICDFTHKYKLVGFSQPEQIEEYVQHYCPNSDQAEKLITRLKEVPSLAQLAEVPMNLAILVKCFEKSGILPNTGTFTKIFHDYYLMNILQLYKYKSLGGVQVIRSTDKLPPEMQKVFNVLSKYAFEYLFHHVTFSEEEISDALFNSSDIPCSFDGLGFFGIEQQHTERIAGESKDYYFLYKGIQELLAVLYLIKLKPQEQLAEMKEIFGRKAYEMIWMFYAGITRMRNIETILEDNLSRQQSQLNTEVPAKSLKDLVQAWKQCHSHFMPITTSKTFNVDFLLILMQCCYEAKNEEACRIIASHVYPDPVCRIEISPKRVSSYLLLAVSYFISHSGKMWSLRCDASIQSGVELLCKHITDSNNLSHDQSLHKGSLWVWCYVVKFSQVDAYCKAIKSQPSLQWIHLLNGSCLDDEGTIKLCECLMTPGCSVIKVEIENCKIGNKGLKSVGHMLNINRRISHIDLRKNCFSRTVLMEFLHDIKDQMNLEYLRLDKDFIEDPEIFPILEEIRLNRKAKNTKDIMIIDNYPA